MKIKQIFKASKTIKRLILNTLFLSISNLAFATTGGAGAITTKLTTWKTSVQTSLNATIGIFAIVGGFLVFFQYMQGNEQAQKNLIRYIIGLGVFGLAGLMVAVFIK